MDHTTLLTALRDQTPGGPLDRLAALSVDALLAQPAASFINPELTVRAVRAGALEWVGSDHAAKSFTRWVESAINQTSRDERRLNDVIDPPFKQLLHALVERPFSPDRRVVLTVIDRGPTRALVRELLLDAVLQFGRRVSAPVSGMAKGLGTLARMASDSVKSRSGSLGSLVGAVSGEVERQLEKRAVDFVDGALSGVFQQIADALSDPQRADEAAQLRLAFIDGALELTVRQLSRELLNADVSGGATLVRDALKKWLESPASTQLLEATAKRLVSELETRTAADVLRELGLHDTVRAIGTEALRARLSDVTTTDAFAQWVASLP